MRQKTDENIAEDSDSDLWEEDIDYADEDLDDESFD